MTWMRIQSAAVYIPKVLLDCTDWHLTEWITDVYKHHRSFIVAGGYNHNHI